MLVQPTNTNRIKSLCSLCPHLVNITGTVCECEAGSGSKQLTVSGNGFRSPRG